MEKNIDQKINEIQNRVTHGSITPDDLLWVLENYKKDFLPLADEIEIINIRNELLSS